jgi:hypothetical protein
MSPSQFFPSKCAKKWNVIVLPVICLQDALLKNKLLEHEKDLAFRRGRSDAGATSESYVKFGWYYSMLLKKDLSECAPG